MNVVGVALVRNEERFVRNALVNVAAFCDRLLVADHRSTDRTPAILEELTRDFDHLEVTRIAHAAESHELIEGLAGPNTGVLAVDGDELYDPTGLGAFRAQLEAGAFADVFRIRPAGLHCDELDEDDANAYGYLSPPGRPLLGLFNFAAIDSWRNVRSQRLHGGDVAFRDGYSWESWQHLGMDPGWEASPLRDLHLCFLPRSAEDEVHDADGRPNLSETRRFRRGVRGALEQFVRSGLARSPAVSPRGSEWKSAKYRRGERVCVDARPFLEGGLST